VNETSALSTTQRRVVLAALVVGAALLRWVAWGRSGAIFDDGPIFLYLADALLEGDFASALRHPYHPGYPLAIAALGSLAGIEVEAAPRALEGFALGLSIAGGAACVGLVYGLVRDAFDTHLALIAAAIAALHPPSVFFSADVQSEGLYLSLFLAAAWAAWRALRDARHRMAFLSGVLAALAYWVRPE